VCDYESERYVIVPGVPPKLVSTGVAAKELGVGRATLARWWKDRLVSPAVVTAGGQARWDMDDLKRQLEALRQRDP
jgi:DNA-binding transcriptional MerR regulator